MVMLKSLFLMIKTINTYRTFALEEVILRTPIWLLLLLLTQRTGVAYVSAK